jgi:carbonic anhydrase
MTDATLNPRQALSELLDGNQRFAEDRPTKTDQDRSRRAELANGQHPFAVVFGCGDSRVAAELVFDQGLGRLFVVRTAGHVVDAGVLGSVEFGVDLLSIPLVVVLGHDSCGAVTAGVEALENGTMPGGFLRDIVEHVAPSVLAAQRAGDASVNSAVAEHVRQTTRLLVERSPVLSGAVEAGRCAVVGLVYSLVEGSVRLVDVIGDVGDLGGVGAAAGERHDVTHG